MAIVDVTVHIDETIDRDRRAKIANTVRAHKGVTAVSHDDKKPHLMLIKFNPDAVTSTELLQLVLDQGVHAELVGL